MNPNTRLLASLGVCVALLLVIASGCSTGSKSLVGGPSTSSLWPQECCPSCGIPRADGCLCQVDFVCYGYNSTSWYEWPEECVDSNDVISGRVATPEIAQPSAADTSADTPMKEPAKSVPSPVDIPPPVEDRKGGADAEPSVSPPVEVKPEGTSRLPVESRPRRESAPFSVIQIHIEPARPRPKANKTTLRIEPLPTMVLPAASEGREVFDLKPKQVGANRLSILDRSGPLQEVAEPSGRVTQTAHLATQITILPTTGDSKDRKNEEAQPVIEIPLNAETVPVTRTHFQQPNRPAEIFFVRPAERKFQSSLGVMFSAPPRDRSQRAGTKPANRLGLFGLFSKPNK